MPSFGEKLKLEREKRAITLEQISLSTKIGTRMLQALEEEKFNQLPGGIFNRGFVRAYARHVGLDEEQAVADYLVASGEGPAQSPAAELEAMAERADAKAPRDSRRIPWGLLAAILLLVALALSLWSRRQHKREGQSAPPAPVATQSVENPQGGAAAGTQAPLANVGNPIHSSAPKSEVEPAAKSTVIPARSTAPVTQASAPALAGEFTVVILAREDSWLSITADGKPTLVQTLLAQDQRAIHARNQVVIRAGNTGALDFVFNGKKLAPQGDYGEVKTLTFGPGGLQPNAPAQPVSQ